MTATTELQATTTTLVPASTTLLSTETTVADLAEAQSACALDGLPTADLARLVLLVRTDGSAPSIEAALDLGVGGLIVPSEQLVVLETVVRERSGDNDGLLVSTDEGTTVAPFDAEPTASTTGGDLTVRIAATSAEAPAALRSGADLVLVDVSDAADSIMAISAAADSGELSAVDLRTAAQDVASAQGDTDCR